MNKAVLLDFDGTIINSQPAINGYFFSLLEKKGVTLTHKERDQLGGVSIEDSLAWLATHKNLHFSPLEKKFHEAYFWFFKMKEIRPFPGAIKLLEELSQEEVKMAIVTNSPKKYTMNLLKKNNLLHYFDAVVSVDDAGVAKPNPKMLAMAANELHTRHKNCVMIDDNEPGIVAAHILGMRSIRLTQEGKKETIADVSLPKIEQSLKFIRQ